jgi:hypothetical protein
VSEDVFYIAKVPFYLEEERKSAKVVEAQQWYRTERAKCLSNFVRIFLWEKMQTFKYSELTSPQMILRQEHALTYPNAPTFVPALSFAEPIMPWTRAGGRAAMRWCLRIWS